MKKKIRRMCVAVCVMMVAVVFAVAVPRATASDGSILFVSDRDEPGNQDIYKMDLSTGSITRLTNEPAIDNHPDLSPDGTKVVFSSTRGAEVDFDIYIANVSDVDGTAIRLTDDSYPNGPQTHYPDRHCHFSPDGSLIVFSSKNRPLDHPIEVASECSVPIIITPPRFYENLNLIKLDAAGNKVSYVELDIRDAWDKVTYPDIWRDDTATYVGHPSFSPDGSQIAFSAAIDGDGTVWEVYTVDIELISLSLVSNSLRRITNGSLYLPNPNPIQMSGGAHFTADGSKIIFSSTRPTQGNSQLFYWEATFGENWIVQESGRLTSHMGNDYVPEPLDDGRVVFVSDRGSPSMCNLPPDVEGPTMDLDIFIMNPDGSEQTNLTDNNTADEMLLIGDEVSWFCGLKPNLSSCTYLPRIFDMEALWLMRYADVMIPTNLLQRFNIPDARPLYTTYWNNLNQYVSSLPHLQSTWAEIYIQTEWLMDTFPGFEDPRSLQNWMMDTAIAQIRDQLFVLPSIMLEDGIGAPVSIDSLQIDGNYTVNIFGVGELTIQVAGPTVIRRSDPERDPDTGLCTIETEILSMELVGQIDSLGPVSVRAGRGFGLPPSKGKIIPINSVHPPDPCYPPNPDYPAESFFDVFYEIEVGDMLSPVTPGRGTDTEVGATTFQSQQESSLILQNQEPFRMEATIDEIPLTDVTFVTSPEQQPVSLIDVRTGQVAGELIICTWNPPILEVDIDIKPGSYPNSINLKSKGVVPVAILTTAQFDASRVDPETVALADSLALRSSMEDVDEDGDLDMVLHVATQDLNLTEDSTEATLTGKTLDGTKIKGTDSVRIVPSKK